MSPFSVGEKKAITSFSLSASKANLAAASFASFFDLPSAGGYSFSSIITWNLNLGTKKNHKILLNSCVI